MKKLLVIVAAILSFSAVNAQVAYLGFQSVTDKTKGGNTTVSHSSSGFLLGGAMNFEIADALGVQPALEINYAGRTEKNNLLGDTKYSSWGVKIPIDVNYGIELAPDFILSVYAGPSIYLGLSNTGKNGNTTYDYYGDTYNRFGLGLGMGAWCDIKEVVRVKAGYDLGLLNRAQDKDNWNYNENAFSISVGYLF
ncbi:MAG: outer membrane beta-barrel protein [Bacteroidaceae bacterium]|nr:outer membrane beta-barrel protein [Bacteroidaceae bacterium]